MDRRSFVGLLTAGAAGQAFSGTSANAQTFSSKKFVVVGGGMAGAACAKYLAMWGKNSGLSVEVTLVTPETQYLSCILSNGVLVGDRSMSDQSFGYSELTSNHNVQVVTASVEGIDSDTKTVTLSTGSTLTYDRLVLAPGVQFDYSDISLNTDMTAELAQAEIPHAWKAGPQTETLRAQLVGLVNGEDVIVTVPKSPYRCPPGPYERVCAIADWLRINRPGSRVICLDENTGITAEKVNFGNAFTSIHQNVDYYPNATIDTVSFSSSNLSQKAVTLVAPATKTIPDPDGSSTAGSPVSSFNVAVVNYIAPHKAGQVAIDLLQGVSGGLVADRWVAVNELSYESMVPGVHVIGDAIGSAQPKSGHMANQQGKVCADAILRLETGIDPYPAPVTNSACYTPITMTTAAWLTAVFAYDPDTGKMKVTAPGVIESQDGATTESYKGMHEWFASLMSDTFT